MKDLRDEIRRPKKVRAVDPIKQIFDENNYDNVILYDAENKPIEFEQVALIALDDSDKMYAILIPVTPMQGVEEGEGVIFAVDEASGNLDVVNDQPTIDKVLSAYEALIAEGDDEDKNK